MSSLLPLLPLHALRTDDGGISRIVAHLPSFVHKMTVHTFGGVLRRSVNNAQSWRDVYELEEGYDDAKGCFVFTLRSRCGDRRKRGGNRFEARLVDVDRYVVVLHCGDGQQSERQLMSRHGLVDHMRFVRSRLAHVKTYRARGAVLTTIAISALYPPDLFARLRTIKLTLFELGTLTKSMSSAPLLRHVEVEGLSAVEIAQLLDTLGVAEDQLHTYSCRLLYENMGAVDLPRQVTEDEQLRRIAITANGEAGGVPIARVLAQYANATVRISLDQMLKWSSVRVMDKLSYGGNSNKDVLHKTAELIRFCPLLTHVGWQHHDHPTGAVPSAASTSRADRARAVDRQRRKKRRSTAVGLGDEENDNYAWAKDNGQTTTAGGKVEVDMYVEAIVAIVKSLHDSANPGRCITLHIKCAPGMSPPAKYRLDLRRCLPASLALVASIVGSSVALTVDVMPGRPHLFVHVVDGRLKHCDERPPIYIS